MKRLMHRLLFATALAGVGSALAMAQAPAAPAQRGPGGGPRGPRPAPTNIKALPKDITGDQIRTLMQQYTGELGVECEFCHAQNPATKRNDFASDANPMKETARFMIGMTADLNTKYLEEMPGRRYADPITCGTCHRGASHPTIFVPKPRVAGERPPQPPAQAPPQP
jgi:hypothetical protein